MAGREFPKDPLKTTWTPEVLSDLPVVDQDSTASGTLITTASPDPLGSTTITVIPGATETISNPCGPRGNFPTDKFADMSPEQVAECLEELDMGEHVDRFLDVGVDGLILMSLTKEDLRRDFDVSGMQATRLLKFAREGWKT